MQNISQLFEFTKAATTSYGHFDNQVYISAENSARTIYLADLPKSITYFDISEFFETNVGPCSITIKRPMFKDFYFAFVQF